MSVAKGSDQIAIAAASIEETREISISTTTAQMPDADGPLVPGRYLLQLRDTDSDAWVWIKTGKFVKGVVLTATVGSGLKKFPLSKEALIAIELNVRKDDNDRIAAITSVGTGKLYISRVSRGL